MGHPQNDFRFNIKTSNIKKRDGQEGKTGPLIKSLIEIRL